MHEAALYKNNSFITLTYEDAQLPKRQQLTHRHFQLFMKRLRKTNPDVRFYMAGEYGPTTQRPHYHAILFNKDFPDRVYLKTTGSKEKIYTSAELTKLWPHGHSSIGDVTFESAAYIARYCMQKITGEQAEQHYKRRDDEGEYQQNPEYNKMSNRPGIGQQWLHFYKEDVYTNDYVIIRGQKCNVPAYYDKLFKRLDEKQMQTFKEEREYKGYLRRDDNTPERLDVKRQVTEAKLKQLQRNAI